MKIRNKTTYLSKPTSIGLFRPIASHIYDSDANICSSTEDNNVNTIHAIWSLIKINSVSFMPFLHLTRGVKVDTRGIMHRLTAYKLRTKFREKKKSIYEQNLTGYNSVELWAYFFKMYKAHIFDVNITMWW